MIPVKYITKEAYLAYGKTTDFKNFQGNPMPEFDKLPAKIKDAWENAVKKTIFLAVQNITSAIEEEV